MAFTLLRIFSIWIFARYVLQLLSLILSQLLHISINNDEFSNIYIADLTLNSILLLFWLVISAFLWFRAEQFSKYFSLQNFTKEESKPDYENKSTLILNISIIVLGIYFVITSVSELMTSIIHIGLMKECYNKYQIDIQLTNMVKPCLTFILGFFCLVKSKRIVWLIKNLKGM